MTDNAQFFLYDHEIHDHSVIFDIKSNTVVKGYKVKKIQNNKEIATRMITPAPFICI